ncbi:MAG: formylglycine-generating enzyme family protein [Pseudomonadales bacterium]|nr:formylglycine-generating enzyme family protein [Pseudomonadales bacterium]
MKDSTNTLKVMQDCHLLPTIRLCVLLFMPLIIAVTYPTDAIAMGPEKSTKGKKPADRPLTRDASLVDFKPAGSLPAKPCTDRAISELEATPGPEMVIIPSGRFYMGSEENEADRDPDERLHGVTIKQPFALSRCEVSLGQFEDFVEDSGYKADSETNGCYAFNADAEGYEQRKDRNWRNPGFPQTRLHPVTCISWRDANAYTRWLSLVTGFDYYLPSEAQWEYAARAGSIEAYYWGQDAGHDQQCIYANGADETLAKKLGVEEFADCEDGYPYTASGGSFQRNLLGLSDMSGNVVEWTADCWHDSYVGAPVDGSSWLDADGAQCARQVLRGGGWNDIPANLRSANRLRFLTDDSFFDVGFRVARAL